MVQTLHSRGVLNLPLKELPWTVDVSTWNGLSSGLEFNGYSLDPQLRSTPVLAADQTAFTRFAGYVAGRDAPTTLTQSPADASAANTSALTYIDGWFCTVVEYLNGTANKFRWNEVQAAGPLAVHPFADVAMSTAPTASTPFLQPLPQLLTDGSLARGNYFTRSSDFTVIYIAFRDAANLANTGGFKIHDGAGYRSQSNVWAGVNTSGSACTQYGGFNWLVTCAGVSAGPCLTTYTLADGVIYSTTNNNVYLALDDATLDAIFQTQNGFRVYAVRNGFLVFINTGGTGPTGQHYECLLCDAGMTEYYLLKFLPLTDKATTQLARTSAWSAAIDVDGWFYFNSGDGADIATILSTGALSVPANPNNPSSLACFQPCTTLP